MELPDSLARYAAALPAHDVDAVAATVSDDLAFVSQGRTLDKPAFLSMLRALYAAFPDWSYEIHAIYELGPGEFSIRWEQGGTHTGTFELPGLDPILPTGRSVAIPPQEFFYRLGPGGLISRIEPDSIPHGAPRAILEQIGVTTPPL